METVHGGKREKLVCLYKNSSNEVTELGSDRVDSRGYSRSKYDHSQCLKRVFRLHSFSSSYLLYGVFVVTDQHHDAEWIYHLGEAKHCSADQEVVADKPLHCSTDESNHNWRGVENHGKDCL